MIATKGGTYFQEIETFDVPKKSKKHQCDSKSENLVINSVLESGHPEILSGDSLVTLLGIPVYRGGRIVSVVSLRTFPAEIVTGVIELWEPVGQYEELHLAKGAFGKLERFQNVSSFIRFENGSGLPGQVWSGGRSVIHDDLSNHPGFLRAAGASAGSLQTAIGLPVAGDRYIASVVLISSQTTPLAKGFEIWSAAEPGYELVGAAYPGMNKSLQFKVGHRLSPVTGMAGLASEHGGATTTSNAKFLYASRDEKTGLESALAMPHYNGDELDSVTVLYF